MKRVTAAPEDTRQAVLITGASTGIGAACAIRLAGSGFRVFAGVRRQEDGERVAALAGPACTPILLDVTDSGSLQQAKRHVETLLDGRGLWALINNAGITIPAPLEVSPMNDVRMQIEVNLTGVIAVTQTFLPMIRMCQGRIVTIGSVQGFLACPFFGVYAATKAALEAFSDALRVELHHWRVQVILVDPGRVVTPIWDKVLDGAGRLLASGAAGPYGAHMRAFADRARATGDRGLTPEAVAAVVERALRARTPKTRYLAGRDAWISALAVRLLPDRVRDAVFIRKYGLPAPVASLPADS